MQRTFHLSATLTSNAIAVHMLLERTHIALLQAGNDDPNFTNIIVNTQVDKPENISTECLFWEVNKLVAKLDEFF